MTPPPGPSRCRRRRRLPGGAPLSFRIAGATLLLAALALLAFPPARVAGESMAPALHDGAWVWVQRLRPLLVAVGAAHYRRGEMVVVRGPRELGAKRYLKRLVALPGDTVSVRPDGVFVDGRLLPGSAPPGAVRPDTFPDLLLSCGRLRALEGYALAELPPYLAGVPAMLEPPDAEAVARSCAAPLNGVGRLRLPPGYVFVLGDNRDFRASEDSRLFGPVPLSRLLGVVATGRR